MQDKKRYVVSMDMYVYAENDYMARKRAHKMKDSLDKHNRRPIISEIGEQPFATMYYRKLDTITEPFDKEDKLPF